MPLNTSSADNNLALIGSWRSAPVRLQRPGLDETYFFRVTLAPNGDNGLVGDMDILYFPTAAKAGKRTVRQVVTVEIDELAGLAILSGSLPRLVSGPRFVGVYEADVLLCELPQNRKIERLTCNWGSDAHGTPLQVILNRQTE